MSDEILCEKNKKSNVCNTESLVHETQFRVLRTAEFRKKT